MYQIKQLPEDFIVKEISEAEASESRKYSYYILKKTGYTTMDALQILSEKFKIPLKNFGFAGNKDKHAITEQKISILGGSRNFENAELRNIELKHIGNGKNPISLGDLEGNEFTITIRNLEENEIKKIKKLKNKKLIIPNLYGPQRFSKNNHLVGKAIVNKDFRMAVQLILEHKGVMEEKISGYLRINRNNHVEALRLIPLKTRKLFVHSYQSHIFNKIADEFLKGNKKPARSIRIPVIGFNFEISEVKDSKLKSLIKEILREEKITPRDFITSQMPELAAEGGFRDLFFELKFKVLEIGEDELNPSRQEVKLNFILPKSCYATVALELLFR